MLGDNSMDGEAVSDMSLLQLDLRRITPRRLLEMYSEVMEELRRRGVVRSSNNPVSDYAEVLASQRLGLKLTKGSNKGFHALDRRGNRYQIKARRLNGRSSRQLGVIRHLKDNPFDVCIAIIFDRKFRPTEVYRIPISAIRKHGKFSRHQNGWIVQLRTPLTSDSRVKNITDHFARR